MNAVQVAVIAKAPVPGTVKTRLCPPYTLEQAAGLAAAALADVMHAVDAAPAARRVLLLDGDHPAPPRWEVVAQRGDGLADRLANGYHDLARTGRSTLIVAGDTPSLGPDLLTGVVALVETEPVDAVLGPTQDGGFWALGLRDPGAGGLLRQIPMSTPNTGERTLRVLREAGLRVATLPRLRDLDTADDAVALAAAYPDTRFAAALRQLH